MFEDLIRQQGTHVVVTTVAIARVLAWQLQEQMKIQGITKVEMARRMGTSRSQLDRLLDPDSGGATLDTMTRAAKAVNRKVRIELV